MLERVREGVNQRVEYVQRVWLNRGYVEYLMQQSRQTVEEQDTAIAALKARVAAIDREAQLAGDVRKLYDDLDEVEKQQPASEHEVERV